MPTACLWVLGRCHVVDAQLGRFAEPRITRHAVGFAHGDRGDPMAVHVVEPLAARADPPSSIATLGFETLDQKAQAFEYRLLVLSLHVRLARA